MPCWGPDGPPNIRSDAAERRLSEVIDDLNVATRAACEMARFIRNEIGVNNDLSQETRDWISDHRKLDAKRAKKKGTK